MEAVVHAQRSRSVSAGLLLAVGVWDLVRVGDNSWSFEFEFESGIVRFNFHQALATNDYRLTTDP